MERFLLQLLEVSLKISAVSGLLMLLSSLLNKRFPLVWKCAAWLVLALRLAIPGSFSPPGAPVIVELPFSAYSIDSIYEPVVNREEGYPLAHSPSLRAVGMEELRLSRGL